MEAPGGSWSCPDKGHRQEYGTFVLEIIHKCNNHVFLISVFDACTSWGFADPGGIAPPRLIPRDCKLFARDLPFVCKPTTQRAPPCPPQNQPSFAGASHTQDHYSPALIIPEPGTRQLRTVSSSQDLLKLFKLSSPKPAYPASPVPSHKNHKKGSCSCFPSPLAS